MKQLTLKYLLCVLVLGTGAIPAWSAPGSAGAVTCPDGYRTSVFPQLEDVCIANTITSTVYPVDSMGGCPQGFANPKGTKFCAVNNAVSVDVKGGRYLLDPTFGRCQSGFLSLQQHSVCVAQHLTLALVRGEAKLVLTDLDCGPGYRQLPGATTCSAKPPLLPLSKTLQECPQGSFRPAGEPRCLSFELARAISFDKTYGFDVPTDPCPEGTSRLEEGGHCFPDGVIEMCFPNYPSPLTGQVFGSGGLARCSNPTKARVIPLPRLNSSGQWITAQLFVCRPGDGEHLAVACPEFPSDDPAEL